MPCNVCEEIFRLKPCDQTKKPTMIVDSSLNLLGSKYINYLYQNLLKPYITKVYVDLMLLCPCKECLVRSACTNGTTCDKYNELMDRSKPIFNRCHFPNENKEETVKLVGEESYESEV
jgi:hypothetical protein